MIFPIYKMKDFAKEGREGEDGEVPGQATAGDQDILSIHKISV
jgi:hypothetical protein